MLDTYLIGGRPQHHYHRHDVHEHRAPTDASVALLKEMEKAASDKIIATMQMPGNLFKGVVEVLRHAADARMEAVAVFDVNGRRCTARAWVDWHDDPRELLRKLHEETARVLAGEILVEMTRGLKL